MAYTCVLVSLGRDLKPTWRVYGSTGSCGDIEWAVIAVYGLSVITALIFMLIDTRLNLF